MQGVLRLEETIPRFWRYKERNSPAKFT